MRSWMEEGAVRTTTRDIWSTDESQAAQEVQQLSWRPFIRALVRRFVVNARSALIEAVLSDQNFGSFENNYFMSFFN